MITLGLFWTQNEILDWIESTTSLSLHFRKPKAPIFFQNVILDSFWPQKDRIDFILINNVMLASFLTKNSRLGFRSYR
jgi:hypothetical protein